MDDQMPAEERDATGSGRGLIWAVNGVLLLLGTLFFAFAGSSVDSARVIDSGHADRVSGVLESCNARQRLTSGGRWCLEGASERLDENAITVAWPAFKDLRGLEGETVVGLADDGWLLAFELPDGSVVRGDGVGWRGVVYWGAPGLGCFGAVWWIWYALRLGDRWRDSLALRFRWKWGLLSVAVVSTHATSLPAALAGDVVWVIATALVVQGWMDDGHGGARNRERGVANPA